MAVFIAMRWGDDMWKIIRGLSLIFAIISFVGWEMRRMAVFIAMCWEMIGGKLSVVPDIA